MAVYRLYTRKECITCPGAKNAVLTAGLDVRILDVETTEGRKEQVKDGAGLSVPCLIEERNGEITGQWIGKTINQELCEKLKGR